MSNPYDRLTAWSDGGLDRHPWLRPIFAAVLAVFGFGSLAWRLASAAQHMRLAPPDYLLLGLGFVATAISVIYTIRHTPTKAVAKLLLVATIIELVCGVRFDLPNAHYTATRIEEQLSARSGNAILTILRREDLAGFHGDPLFAYEVVTPSKWHIPMSCAQLHSLVEAVDLRTVPHYTGAFDRARGYCAYRRGDLRRARAYYTSAAVRQGLPMYFIVEYACEDGSENVIRHSDLTPPGVRRKLGYHAIVDDHSKRPAAAACLRHYARSA